MQRLGQFLAAQLPDYPNREGQYRILSEITGGDEVGVIAKQQLIGYVFSNENRTYVLQVKPDTFALSRLPPYECWEDFITEARKLWAVYSSIVEEWNPIKVSVRYVNRLRLRQPMGDIRDFVLTAPEIAPDLSQALSNFTMRLEIPQEDIGAMLILAEGLTLSDEPNSIDLILDIDIVHSIGDGLPRDIWATLELLRIRKNQVFEACITDRMRKEFQV